MRKELNLYNIDNLLFDAITHLADKDRNGKFTYEKFHQNLEKILPKIMRPGEDMKNMLRKAFMDFDIDRSGTLEKNELKLWITLTCDLMKVERCSEWHIDYIISLIDDNGDLKIDQEEFMINYWIIIHELMKNKPLEDNKKDCSLFDGFKFGSDDDRKSFLEYMSVFMNKKKKRKTKRCTGKDNENNGDQSQKLDLVNNLAKEQARSQILISDQMNSVSPMVEVENVRKISCEAIEEDNLHPSMQIDMKKIKNQKSENQGTCETGMVNLDPSEIKPSKHHKPISQILDRIDLKSPVRFYSPTKQLRKKHKEFGQKNLTSTSAITLPKVQGNVLTPKLQGNALADRFLEPLEIPSCFQMNHLKDKDFEANSLFANNKSDNKVFPADNKGFLTKVSCFDSIQNVKSMTNNNKSQAPFITDINNSSSNKSPTYRLRFLKSNNLEVNGQTNLTMKKKSALVNSCSNIHEKKQEKPMSLIDFFNQLALVNLSNKLVNDVSKGLGDSKADIDFFKGFGLDEITNLVKDTIDLKSIMERIVGNLSQFFEALKRFTNFQCMTKLPKGFDEYDQLENCEVTSVDKNTDTLTNDWKRLNAYIRDIEATPSSLNHHKHNIKNSKTHSSLISNDLLLMDNSIVYPENINNYGKYYFKDSSSPTNCHKSVGIPKNWLIEPNSIENSHLDNSSITNQLPNIEIEKKNLSNWAKDIKSIFYINSKKR